MAEDVQPNVVVEGREQSRNVGYIGRADSINLGDTNTYYYSQTVDDAVLRREQFDLSIAIRPTNLKDLIARLNFNKILLISSRSRWLPESVALHIATRYLSNAVVPDNDLPIYVLASETSIQRLLDEIRRKHQDLRLGVIFAPGLQAKQFSANPELLLRLVQLLRQLDIYMVATTIDDEQDWIRATNQDSVKQYIVDFDAQQAYDAQLIPYRKEDLVDWLVHRLNEERSQFSISEFVPEYPVHSETTLDKAHQITVQKVVNLLVYPELVQRFANRLIVRQRVTQEIKSQQTVQEIIDDLKTEEQHESQATLRAWFEDLQPSARYFVLAVCLVNGLPQETFWAIYERLTAQAWRERDQQISMTDYLDITNKLDKYIEVNESTIGLRNSSYYRWLIGFALDNYRRSLVQAIPILADIVSGANLRISTMDDGAVSRRLPLLAIFGSDLESLAQGSTRQRTLKNSLTASIAEIARRERATTEHLLVAWAEHGGDLNDNQSGQLLREAAALTMVQMFRMEDPVLDAPNPIHKYPTVAMLLRWYKDYQYDPRSPRAYQQRRARIRAAIAMFTSYIGRYLTPEDFGATPEQVRATLLMPDHEPQADEIQTPAQLIAALAWDREPIARAGVTYFLSELVESHPIFVAALVEVLSTDWDPNVLLALANQLVKLYIIDPRNLYLIYGLLDQPAMLKVKRDVQIPGHYLNTFAYQQNINTESAKIGVGVYAFILSMLFSGNAGIVTFRSFLRSRLTQNPYLAEEFASILINIFHSLVDENNLSLLKHDMWRIVLTDKDDLNKDSALSLAFEESLHKYIVLNPSTEYPRRYMPLVPTVSELDFLIAWRIKGYGNATISAYMQFLIEQAKNDMLLRDRMYRLVKHFAEPKQ